MGCGFFNVKVEILDYGCTLMANICFGEAWGIAGEGGCKLGKHDYLNRQIFFKCQKIQSSYAHMLLVCASPSKGPQVV